MNKVFIILVILVCIFSCTVSYEYDVEMINEYPGEDFEYVYAYKMKDGNKSVVEDGALSDEVVLPGLKLKDDEILALLQIFTDKNSYGNYPARCFNPHLGFVFYKRNKDIVAHSSICLDCNWMTTKPDIGPIGFSSEGREALRNLEVEIFTKSN